MKDLTGQKFNMLTVIDCAGKLDWWLLKSPKFENS